MARQENQSDRERAEKAALIEQYRSIGPAAILAALVCAQDKTKARKQATDEAA